MAIPLVYPLGAGIAGLVGAAGTQQALQNQDLNLSNEELDLLKFLSAPNAVTAFDFLKKKDQDLTTTTSQKKKEEEPTPEPPKGPLEELNDALNLYSASKQAKKEFEEIEEKIIVDPKEYTPKMKMDKPFEYVEVVNPVKIFGNQDVRQIDYKNKKADPINYQFSEDKLEEIKNTTLQDYQNRTGVNVQAMVERFGLKMPNIDTLNNSLKRDEAARYWYELSSQYFGDFLQDLSDDDKSKFLDVLSITSGGVTPKENFKIALGVFSDLKAGRPIRMGFRQIQSLDKLLKDPTSSIYSPKFKNFTDSFGYFMGTTDRQPNTVNDLQMADIFGIKPTALAGNPDLYGLMTMALNNLTAEVNANLPEGQEPLQPYQLQAILWTENRGGRSTNYAEVAPDVIEEMRELGYEFKDGKLSLEEITNPDFVRDIQKTVKPFEESVKMTVESGSFLTEAGKKIQQLVENFSDDNVLMEQISKINKAANNQLITRKDKQPSIIEKLFSVLTGSNVGVSRMQKGFGTFEGQVGDNVIIPSTYTNNKGEIVQLSPDERQQALAILGKHLNQKAVASSNFTDIEPGEEVEEGKNITNSFYVPETKYSSSQLQKVHQLSGYDFNVVPVPGGFVLDTITFGGEKPDTEKVGNAILEVFGKDRIVEVVDSKWFGDYIEEELYEELENAAKKSITARMEKEGDPLESFSNIVSLIEEISRARDEGYKNILDSTKVINLLKKNNIQLKNKGGTVSLPEIPSLVNGGLVDINYLTRPLNNGR